MPDPQLDQLLRTAIIQTRLRVRDMDGAIRSVSFFALSF
jgi:hypothetical protein